MLFIFLENIAIDSSYLLNDEEFEIPDDEVADHVRYSPERVNLISKFPNILVLNKDITQIYSVLECKQYHQISKVVNGRDAKPREFPHMVRSDDLKQNPISEVLFF